MFVHQQPVKMMHIITVLILFIETTDMLPAQRIVIKKRLTYRFGTLYDKENTSMTYFTGTPNPLLLKPSEPVSIPFDIFDQRNDFGVISKLSNLSDNYDISTVNNVASREKVNENKKKYDIDEQILHQIFDNDIDTRKTTATVEEAQDTDLTTETDFESTTFGNFTEDDRYGGGLAAQHAIATLLGGG